MATYTDALRGYGVEVFERDRWKCQYCGMDCSEWPYWTFLTIDHIIPKQQGGTNDSSNLVTACRACNGFCNRETYLSNDPKLVFEEKKKHILAKREEFKNFWEENVKSKL